MTPHGVSGLCLVHCGPRPSRWGFTRCVPCLLSYQRRIRAVFHHELDLAWQTGARDRHRVNLGGQSGKLELGLAGPAASGHESCLCQHCRAWLGNQNLHVAEHTRRSPAVSLQRQSSRYPCLGFLHRSCPAMRVPIQTNEHRCQNRPLQQRRYPAFPSRDDQSRSAVPFGPPRVRLASYLRLYRRFNEYINKLGSSCSRPPDTLSISIPSCVPSHSYTYIHVTERVPHSFI